ncbi:MAG: hypothetical protein GF329_00740 [Candidatus Lokiarchaeota archaeon]|nr:hypothetical protein [Candidatus Lokiarchaeota archaeon]
MNFLAYSDFHGLFGFKNHFRKIKKDIKRFNPDFVVFCGDFRNKVSKSLLNVRVKHLGRPVYYVWGNDDEFDPEYKLKSGINLHLKVIEVNEAFKIVGLGGDELDVKWNIEKFDEILDNEKDSDNLVIVSHVPPYSACDLANDGRNVGVKEYLALILKFSPRLVLFGHIHENFRCHTCIEGIDFINIGPNGVLFEYSEGSFLIDLNIDE